MNSVDAVLERFDLDPLKFFSEECDPDIVFSESRDTIIHEMYTEASNGATKTSVLQKLINFLKKAWAFICKWAGKALNFLKSLFVGKKKTMDQIVDEVVGIDEAPSSSGSSKSAPSKTSSKSVSSGSSNQDSSSNSGFSIKTSVPIPSNPKSEVEMPPSVDVIMKPFTMAIDASKKSIKLNYYIVNDNMYHTSADRAKVQAAGNQGEIIGQAAVKRGSDTQDWDRVVMMIKWPEVLDKYMECISIIGKETFSQGELVAAFRSYDSAWGQAWNRLLATFKSLEFSFDEINAFQVKLNEIHKIVEKIDIPNIESVAVKKGADVNVIDLINNIVGQAANLQMGVNALTSVIQNSFKIDQRHIGKIDDIEKLSLFVQKCIEAGIPSKYISYDAYLVSSESIHGDGSKGSKENPIWGQSRVVFFPTTGDSIHKLALSQWGVRANKSEIGVSEKFKSLGEESMLAMVVSKTKNDCIIDAEKVDTDHEIIPSTAQKFIDDVDKFCRDNKIPLDITGDVSSSGHNLGIKNGKPVIIDYGMADRTSVSVRTA